VSNFTKIYETIYGIYGFVVMHCNCKQEQECPDSCRWKSSILNIDICTKVYGAHDVHFGLMQSTFFLK